MPRVVPFEEAKDGGFGWVGGEGLMAGEPVFCACTVPPHLTNCIDCGGFGMKPGQRLHNGKPVMRWASEAMAGAPAEDCPTCHTGGAAE